VLLLQFSTSHYCRKARLALGYKQIAYRVENLTPGAHILKLKPLTGLTTVPVLMPEVPGFPEAIADSTRIFEFLETYQSQPPLFLADDRANTAAKVLEDWLDESIGTATRFVYYDYRSKAGKAIDPSLFSQLLIRVVKQQYNINDATVELARDRLKIALTELCDRWQDTPFLVGDRLSIADLSAAALLSPLALIPDYRNTYSLLFDRIAQVHDRCGEPQPPGLGD